MRSPVEPVAPLLFVEALEPRIAPAVLNPAGFTSATIGTPLLLKAGQGLSTSNAGGAFLLFVEAGQALVFTTDINGNKQLDFNEITGIAAGDGLRLLAFTDIHGDIVTNLLPSGDLTDSDNDSTNGRDGRVLLDSRIDKIELRSLVPTDLNAALPGNTVSNRLALSGYSIFGTIYTGGDFGSAGNGLIVNTSGAALQQAKFSGNTGLELFTGTLNPSIGGIKTGTAANGGHFSFGNSFGPANNDVSGSLLAFQVPAGEHGGDITGVKSTNGASFSAGTLATGDGGIGFGATGARGGNLAEITLQGERGASQILAGDGGAGTAGGTGGSVVGFNDLGSVTGEVIIHTGSGGRGVLGVGGAAGAVTFGTVNIAANVRVLLGDGGDGLTGGGNGAGQPNGTFRVPESDTPLGVKILSTWRDPYTFQDPFTGQLTATPKVGDQLVVVPDPASGQPMALHAYDIGATRPFDFDGDGFSDALFTSATPDQLVVLFGKSGFAPDAAVAPPAQDNQIFGFLFDPSKTLFLNAPANPQAVVVGDFNADGRPDIAVASAEAGNFGGVQVFLNQVGDPLRNPTDRPAFTGNPLGDHVFSDPLHTPIPTLAEFSSVGQEVLKSPVAIRNLVAGDFNGDGVMDLAYLGVYQFRSLTAVAPQNQLTVLFGDTDAESAFGNGHFFANAALPTDPVPVRIQTSLISSTVSVAPPLLIATSFTQTAFNPNAPLGPATVAAPAGQHDSLFAGVVGLRADESKFIAERGVSFNPATHQPNGSFLTPELGQRFSLGQVDTNRGNEITLTDVTLRDFTVLDFNKDGRLDLAILSDQPVQFLVTYTGSGSTLPGNTFNLTVASQIAATTNNTGLKINENGRDLALRPTTDASGYPSRLAALSVGENPLTSAFIREGTFTFVPPVTNPTTGVVTGNANFFRLGPGETFETGIPTATVGNDRTVVSFDLFNTRADGAGVTGFDLFYPSRGTNFRDFAELALRDSGITDVRLTANGIELNAGSGGNAVSGPGGRGGTIGGALSAGGAGGPVGSVAATLPAFLDFAGVVSLFGGAGGNGFTAGGLGGDISGVSLGIVGGAGQITGDARLVAGDGGRGVAGAGGRGGDIAQLSLVNGSSFLAGNGGAGLTGGRGGNILGNTFGTTDTGTTNITATAGLGGTGSFGGGDGGSINNFRAQFLPVIGGVGGNLTYNAGDAGGAAGGNGGRGGTLLNDSPATAANFLAGAITLNAGDGGAGLAGGPGGSVNTFVNSPTTPSAVPNSVAALGGNGGAGINDRGGAGGAIQSLNVTASGLRLQNNGQPAILLSEIIAGAGGASFGADGGAGGLITATNVTSISAPTAAAAGTGGLGLTSGGNGGAINATTLNSAGSTARFGKVLVIAGVGGDAFALTPTDVNSPGDPLIAGQPVSLVRQTLAFGGQSGVGGNGGSVSNFTQPTGTAVNVDIIAGNGGSTVNYGNSLTPTGNVGRGGSVTNVIVTGEIGASLGETISNVSPPIRSYTDTNNDGVEDLTLAQFVATTLRSGDAQLVSFNDNPALTNVAVGNVGIVAGVAGRVAAVNGVPQPAVGVPNGAVQFVTARNIMSIVAGSVDSVSPVDNVVGLRLTSAERILGADKSPLNLDPTGKGNGVPDYLDLTGRVVRDLQPGDRLIDGAVFAFANTTGDLAGSFGNPRVFIVPQG